ncbi:MAG: rfaE [Gemmatimonadetes bacterium]|nr:rfaE [Gemmatimonadota bacterium]
MPPSLSRDRAAQLLNGARDKRIIVIGDAMLDVYLTGDVDRISPEAPVPVVRIRGRKNALGGAANVAQNVVALGSRCDLVAAVGSDVGGATLRELVAASHIGSEGLVVVDRITTTKTRIVARSQQLARIDEEEDDVLPERDVQRIIGAISEIISRADGVILEDYDKGVLSSAVIRFAIDQANRQGIPIVVDPKFRNFFAYEGATIFKPNVRELGAAMGAGIDIDHPDTLPAMVERLQVQYVLLTLGERGMALFSRDGEIARVPTHARQVYDVVGAGDTVTAYLASMLAAGATAEEAAAIANVAAGIEVGKLGAATVSAGEVLAALLERSSE